MQIRGAVSAQGIQLNLEGVAIVKVGGTEDAIRAGGTTVPGPAVEHRDVHPGDAGRRAALHRRRADRRADHPGPGGVRPQVAEESETSLTGQGLVLDTFQIQDITDDGTYLRDLGRPEAALVGQRARSPRPNARAASEPARLERRAADRGLPARRWRCAGRDQGRDRRRSGPGRRRRPAGRGRPAPGRADRAGEGRRAAGRADRAPARHRGPQAGRRRPVQGRAGGPGPRSPEIAEAEARKAAAIAGRGAPSRPGCPVRPSWTGVPRSPRRRRSRAPSAVRPRRRAVWRRRTRSAPRVRPGRRHRRRSAEAEAEA